jgi:glucokinase
MDLMKGKPALHHIGVDLGGTTMAVALLDEGGRILEKATVPTLAHHGHDAVIDRIAQLIHQVINSAGVGHDQVGAIGIGVPGVLAMEKGLTLFLPNLPGTWPRVPLAPRIEEAVGLPTFLLNDVRSITLGEKTYGAGQEVDNMVCLAIGTGIGGGVVVGGKLLLGLDGTAGELGHQIIDPYGPRCGCGNRGCLEAFASGPAIASMGLRAVKQGLTTRIGELCDYDLNAITPKLIYQAALEGDAVAQEIYEMAGFYIGIGVANLITILSPQMVVIGGGVAQAGELLLAPIREAARQRVHVTPFEKVQIVQAELSTDAGMIGAAVWAQQQLAVRRSMI